MIDFHLISFFIIGGIMLISAVMVLLCREVVHSAMFLALTFAMVGCLYILLNAEYVALVQIIIYAGAVTVLMLFAIMLTKRRILGEGTEESRIDTYNELTAAVFLLWLMLLSISAPVLSDRTYSATLDRSLAVSGTMQQMAALLFTSYILPLLMVGVLLVVAMLGGVFMAREREEED